MSKCLDGIIGCKYKTSSWHLNGLYCIGDVGLYRARNLMLMGGNSSSHSRGRHVGHVTGATAVGVFLLIGQLGAMTYIFSKLLLTVLTVFYHFLTVFKRGTNDSRVEALSTQLSRSRGFGERPRRDRSAMAEHFHLPKFFCSLSDYPKF